MGLHSGDKGKAVLDKDTIWSNIRDPNDYDDDDEEDEEEEEDHDRDYDDEEEEDPRKKHKPKPALYRGESSGSAKIKSVRKSTAAKTLPRRRTSVGNIFVDDIAAAAASGPEDHEEEEAMHENNDCFHGAAKRSKVSTGNPYSTKNLRNCNNASTLEETEEDECEMDDDEVELVSPESSKFWKVKCKPDRELEAVTTLMQKSIDMEAIGKSLLIKSAIAPTHLKGYIYIEAENELLASQACRGMAMLASFKPLFVPSTEIANITQIVKVSPVRKGDWVRLKAGLYKGDFAKVLSLVNCKQQVNVQLVPRISLRDLKEKMDLVATRQGRELTKKSNCSGIEEEEKSLKTQAAESKSHCDGLEKEGKNLKTKTGECRPQPCFITEDKIRKLSIPVKQKKIKDQILYSVGNMLFMDGYLVKKVALRSLDILVKPTLEELQMFQRPGGKDPAAVFNSSSFIKSARFMEGDTVMVVEGDHQSLVGYVERVDGEKVSIRTTSEKMQEVVVLHKRQIVKFFLMGDHVQVLEGSYQGATGIIVDADKLHAIILSDATKEEIRVMKDCIAPSSEVASVMSKLGEFNLFDLVLLDHSKCGLILRIEKERLQVLEGIAEKMVTSMVKPTDVQKKVISNNTSVRDSGKNVIRVKDSVEVLEGTFKGKKGPVHYIYGDLLFIHDPDHLENSGFMCIRTNECLVFGGKRAGTRHNQNSTDFPRKRRQYPEEDGGNFGKKERFCKEDSMIGHNVIVKRGMYKGYRGRVVRATGPFRQVYLETQMRIVTMQAGELKDLDTVVDGNGAADWTAAVQDGTSNASEGNNGWGADATEQKEDTWNANEDNGQDGWGADKGDPQEDGKNGWGATVDKKDEDDAWGGGKDGCLQKEDPWGTSSKEDGKNEWGAIADKEDDTWGGGKDGCSHKENSWGTSSKEDGQSGWGETAHKKEEEEKNAGQDTGHQNIDKEAKVFDNGRQNNWENTRDDMEWKSLDDETANGPDLTSPEEEAQVQNASEWNPSSQQDNWAAASINESAADESGW